MNTYNTIMVEKRAGIGYLTLNRPEVRNAFNQEMIDEIRDALRTIDKDEEIRVLIITGAGRAFQAGADIAELSVMRPMDILRWNEGIVRINAALEKLRQPVIAAINGDALGQGLELALSCDIRLASDKANLGFPQIVQGLIPMDGGTQRLPRIVGKSKALELILTGEIISAQEALEIGLVNKVIAKEELIAEAEAIARTMTTKGPIALRYAKEAVNKGLDLSLEQGLHLEADLYLLLHTTEDRTEGIRAFLEKRPPKFKGR